MAYLVIERGETKGARIQLSQFPFAIGRENTNQLIIVDPDVSRSHCQIKKRGNLYILEDLGSRNGTYLNGDRVLNATIKSGDRLLVGNHELLFLASMGEIHILQELTDLEWNVDIDTKLGLDSPLILSQSQSEFPGRAQRYDLAQLRDQPLPQKSTALLAELHQDILTTASLDAFCKIAQKAAKRLFPSISRSAILIWQPQHRSLLPYSHKTFQGGERFHMTKEALKDVVGRKQGLSSLDHRSQIPFLLLPLLSGDQLLGIAHFELPKKTKIPAQVLPPLARFLHMIAPVMENFLLRREMDEWLVGMMETIIATVEAKDTYTRGHSERVCKYSLAIADALKLPRDTKKMLMFSALCHDIGKVGIPDRILKKASILSAEEYQEMKLHPLIGEEIVKHLPNYHRFVSGIKYHHEKWDGTGYPDGLAGEEIPFFGRIIGLADVFDAMVSGRAYSGFLDQTEAIEKLSQEKELFDPQVFKAFLQAYEKGAISLKTSTQSGQTEPPLMKKPDEN